MSSKRPPLARWTATTTAALALAALGAQSAAAVPIGESRTGSMTWYDDAGYGACGTRIDAATQDLVAVPAAWWTTANPNDDPLCKGVSVQVTYRGATITVPVRDKCPSCAADHIDLSRTAFARLADLDLGVVSGITWQFVGSGGGGGPVVLPAPAGLSVTAVTAASASLAWSPVSGAVSYAVYRDGTRIGTATGTGYTASGLSAATAYRFNVAAVDGTGTLGTLSAAVAATTSASGGGGGGACNTPWSAATSYGPGTKVSYAGHNYTATYYSTGAAPDDPASWAVWHDDGSC
ncbi:cysteine/serine endopeptidase inhibitor [Kitasatospora sp. NPDC049285]|uniref:cysteine/serine endopeptidase inhibitor n=1 Tax=Kitasatospora sp. NPDC049285 TaxID=3157096 RepID=UPI0034380FE5